MALLLMLKGTNTRIPKAVLSQATLFFLNENVDFPFTILLVAFRVMLNKDPSMYKQLKLSKQSSK